MNKNAKYAYLSCKKAENYIGLDSSRALMLFHEALRLDPNCYPAYAGVGRVYAMDGDISLAAKAFEKSCEINSSTRETMLHMGLTFKNLLWYDKAKLFYDNLLDLFAGGTNTEYAREVALVG
jgi:tetratricopeptide (TPR) repeat protein